MARRHRQRRQAGSEMEECSAFKFHAMARRNGRCTFEFAPTLSDYQFNREGIGVAGRREPSHAHNQTAARESSFAGR
jgi:hypothetical protein